ncbi:uncharacterized protein LOC111375259 [Olea europaea var. sylvestris]|uniref:uncharacterized protein LOC111375259 n=1 Tax=Olea europaea var. sylvestris TaxID=158386 RepID=UPI000C1D314F|nr:uncharacterized protein LOC111375259 [Olea europaea var. sylvestris]
MPLSVFKKLGLEEVKPTTLTLQLVDTSIIYTKGIKDVSVKVDKFIFLMDFVVLDMEEDEKVPLKEVMSKKKKLEEFETVKLIDEYSAILLKKLPKKLKDPDSFNIPCIIVVSHLIKQDDLRASINLMPLSVFKKLGLGEVKPTTFTLQLANRSIIYTKGIKDALVKVDKFIFPMDFVVLYMEEDEKVPLILDRPFVATRRALIDVQEGKLTQRVIEDQRGMSKARRKCSITL